MFCIEEGEQKTFKSVEFEKSNFANFFMSEHP